MMERIQSTGQLNLKMYNPVDTLVLPAENTEVLSTFYGNLGFKVKALRFNAEVNKKGATKTRETESYSMRLKRLNAFGLNEITDRITMSLLAVMGYHTGQNGLSAQLRRRILDRIYFNNLPKGTDEGLVKRWAEQGPEERLRLMAETLTYVCLSRENQIDPDALLSVRELKEDLRYLRRMYYYPSYNYAWPSIKSGVDAIITNTVMVKSKEEVRVKSLFGAVYTLTRKILLLA